MTIQEIEKIVNASKWEAASIEQITAALYAAYELARAQQEQTNEDLDDIAESLFHELCEGDGEHSEALDRALIKKHLLRATRAQQEQRAESAETTLRQVQARISQWRVESAEAAYIIVPDFKALADIEALLFASSGETETPK